MKRLVIIGFFALAALSAPREARAEPDLRLNNIRRDIQAASTDPARLPAAMENLERLYPSNQGQRSRAVQAYYASMLALQGKYAPALLDKIRYLFQSLDLYKGLVEAAPEDIDVRFLRYSLYCELPVFFGVAHLVKPDLKKLIELLAAGNYNDVPKDAQRGMMSHLLLSGRMGKAQALQLRALLALP